MSVQIFTRDASGVSDYEIDQFTQLDVVLRMNDISTWSISQPVTEAALALARPGMSVIIKGNGWELAGPVGAPANSAIERDWGTTGTGSSDLANDVVISGIDDKGTLWERICYPCLPDGTPPTLFSADAHDTRSGPAETVMIGYVNANIGGGDWSTGGLANRVMPGLTFNPDQGRGVTVSANARFDVLGTLLQQLAIAGGGLIFDIVNQAFTISQPQDLSAEAVFAEEIGNLLAYQYALTTPIATHVIVGGGDQDVARTFVMGGDDVAASLWRRIEVFSDQRGTTDVGQLTQTLNQDLIDDAAQTALNIRPIDIETLTFGIDYNLGDLVTSIVDGQAITQVVRQVEITIDQSGQVVVPTLQSATTLGVAAPLTYFSALRKLSRRVSNLERTL